MSGGGKGGTGTGIAATKYFISVLFGVCYGKATSIRSVWLGEKLLLGTNAGNSIFRGRLFNLKNDEFFGGEEAGEGGIDGAVWFMDGDDFQVLPSPLSNKFYGSTVCPGHRGIVCLALTERMNDVTFYPEADETILYYQEGGTLEDAGFGGFASPDGGSGGFLHAANNPYLKNVWVEVSVIPDRWFPETSVVYRDPADQTDWESGTEMQGIRGKADCNLIHALLESFVNPEWGFGMSHANIDDAAWREAAQVAYDERLGGSFTWTQPMENGRFAQLLADHLQALVFPDPVSGLTSIKLLRGDYTVASLPVYDVTNSQLTSISEKDAGEVVNEVSVSWTNPETFEVESVFAQDLASIASLGKKVTETHSYEIFRRQDLADQTASRDVLARTGSLRTGVLEVPSSSGRLKPGDMIVIDFPEDAVFSLPVRVTKVEIGRPGGRASRASFVEDVLATTAVQVGARPGSSGTELSYSVEPPFDEELISLPYFAAKQAGLSVEDGEEYAGILVASDQSEAYGAMIYSDRTDTLGNSVYQKITEVGLARRGVLEEDLVPGVTTNSVEISYLGAGPRPRVGDFVQIGPNPSNAELAVITLVGSTTVNLLRGVLDTVPKSWSEGANVWLIPYRMRFFDPVPRLAGSTKEYDIRTSTFYGTLPDGQKVTVGESPEVIEERVERPLRPAAVTIQGSLFNGSVTPIAVASPVTVGWAHRNRLTEDSIILSWDDSSVTPEPDVTITVEVYNAGGTRVVNDTGNTGASTSISLAGEPAGEYEVRVFAERDGLRSFQRITRMITIS